MLSTKDNRENSTFIEITSTNKSFTGSIRIAKRLEEPKILISFPVMIKRDQVAQIANRSQQKASDFFLEKQNRNFSH